MWLVLTGCADLSTPVLLQVVLSADVMIRHFRITTKMRATMGAENDEEGSARIRNWRRQSTKKRSNRIKVNQGSDNVRRVGSVMWSPGRAGFSDRLLNVRSRNKKN